MRKNVIYGMIVLAMISMLLLAGCVQKETAPEKEAEVVVKEQPETVVEKAPVQAIETKDVVSSGDVTILGKEGFSPAEVTVSAGAKVNFENQDKKNMVLIFKNAATKKTANSDLIKAGVTYTHTFAEAGTYDYWTTAYGVKGKVIVE